MISSNTFFGTECSYEDARIVVFGAPFDSTTSYRPGTRFASRTMRAESYGLEYFSPGQNVDLSEVPFHDAGDLELPFGDTNQTIYDVGEFAADIINHNKFPIMIGGEHILTLATVAAMCRFFKDIAIVHFDAHADLREDYLGVRLSHATVMRRIHELTGDNSIFQFGIRSGDKAELEFARQHTHLHLFDFEGLDDVINKIKDSQVYLTIDLDVLDPSVFPGTGTPEAGGVSFVQLMNAAFKVIDSCNVIACDLMELSPPYDPSGISTATALKLLREMLIRINTKLSNTVY